MEVLESLLQSGGPVMYVLLICSIVVVGVILDRAFFWLLEWRRERTTAATPALLVQEGDRFYASAVRNLSGLDTIISIAPLLGILGTVLGIMKSFHALDLQHLTNPGEISHGLAEAMLTTAAGLTIAVPAIVGYNFFQSLARRKCDAIYRQAEELERELAEGRDVE